MGIDMWYKDLHTLSLLLYVHPHSSSLDFLDPDLTFFFQAPDQSTKPFTHESMYSSLSLGHFFFHKVATSQISVGWKEFPYYCILRLILSCSAITIHFWLSSIYWADHIWTKLGLFSSSISWSCEHRYALREKLCCNSGGWYMGLGYLLVQLASALWPCLCSVPHVPFPSDSWTCPIYDVVVLTYQVHKRQF